MCTDVATSAQVVAVSLHGSRWSLRASLKLLRSCTNMSAAAWKATRMSPADRGPQGRDACLWLSSKQHAGSGSLGIHAQRLCDRITRRDPRCEACALARDEDGDKHMNDTIVVLPLQEDNYVQNRLPLPSGAHRTQAAIIQKDGRFLHDSAEHGMSLAVF